MPDLKQISHEIAKAIFDSIEQDRTLILSRIADVVHKELAVRLTELEREMYLLHEVKPERKREGTEPVGSEDEIARFYKKLAEVRQLPHSSSIPSKSFERMNEIAKSIHDSVPEWISRAAFGI